MLIPPSGNRREAMQNSIELAVKAEALGYERLWYGEHHASCFFASCSPEILLPMIASYTETIRIGSGGILLNYYRPFKIAETFIALNNFFPGRIDLGIGRGSSGDVIDSALGKHNDKSLDNVVELLQWLEHDFPPDNINASCRISANDIVPKVWLLGSSSHSALKAANLSMPYVFADFFSPDIAHSAVRCYFENFKVIKGMTRSANAEAILALRVICADSENELRRLIAPLHIMAFEMEQGIYRNFRTADQAIKEIGTLPRLKAVLEKNNFLSSIIIGTPEQISEKIYKKINGLDIKEILIQDLIPEHEARLRSYELIRNAAL